ncbi:MAG TPA: pyridoxamine 5'-phosphate oxidase family protein [Pseudolabrys sp.]|nr:pyridoxamine 5'-phosphate oxidase family protein [Pseudolabrys sp.]
MAEPDIDRIWELMSSISFCMLTNWDGARLHSRPMKAMVRREENAVYFFTDVRAHKDDEIVRFPQVCIGFADPGSQKYVSLSGSAEVLRDKSKLRELWAAPAKAWWGSPDDPNVRLIKITPDEAECWDAPGNLISGLRIALSIMAGRPPNHAGEHQKARLRGRS